MSDLPDSWAIADLGDLLRSIVGGGTPSKAHSSYFQGDIPFMTVKDMHERFIADTQDHISDDALADSASTLIPADTLIIASRMSLGKIARPRFPTAINQDLKALFLHAGIDKTYVEYAWRANEERIQGMGTGTTVKGIRLEDIRTLQVPVAPASEQKLIGEKLDILLARVNACNDRFDAIPALVKRFRQSVLDSAISGRLTEAWRIEQSRSDQWPLKPLGELGQLGRGKSKHRPRNDHRLYGGPYPFIQTGDVAQSGGLITRHAQSYSEMGLQQSKLWPAGTVCITIAANIADTAILTYPACFPDSVVGLVPDATRCIGRFVKWSIDVIKGDIEAFAPATAQKNINLSVLNDIAIRCPELDEQTEIVRRVEALFALADRIEARCTAARTHAQRLAPQLLAKAFRGELVPQDPTDEPASVLLARIAAERSAATTPMKTRQPRMPRAVRAPKETAAMTKSRQDADVSGQPYLAKHLRRLGGEATPELLFKSAELPVADFYKQLAWEVAHGHVLDGDTTLGARDAA
jgi:type I restriction enzyme, S subunit